ncbi:hypothetical protein BOX15_Mlig006134g1 [Macrostomum lignano]|uniref:Uncharacterized protein n=1 Tax=Macrostomum lignano TaxID=282301 RepID=A0A267G0U9_9PLAT|nr:hypothetical protein BOX15_Mlig006134g2 [Macrostomum lignano]PAA93664.1 hypothetical protein BOX15_Mlig006134g1 [Macrostomum lignano]
MVIVLFVSTQRYIRYSKKSRLSNISDVISRSGQLHQRRRQCSACHQYSLTATSVTTSSSSGGFSGELSGCTIII